MYYAECESVLNNHHFLPLVGIGREKATTDIFHPGPLVLFDGFNHDDSSYRQLILHIIEKRKGKNLKTSVIYEYSFETGIGEIDVFEYMNQVKGAGLDDSDVTFILNKCAKDSMMHLTSKYRFYFLNHFALKLYSKFISGNIKLARKRLVDRKIGINVLVAQLHWKKTRLHTLYSLYKKNLLQSAITGILTLKEHIENLEHEIPDKDFWQWLYAHLGPVDDVKVYPNLGFLISPGFPYSIDTYNNSRVTHICETLCPEMPGPKEFLTEKTYKPIINLSPFVLQGHQHHLEYLQSEGYQVFDRYIDISYDKEPFKLDKIEHSTEATKQLLIATINYPNEIEMITQHNYRRLMDIGRQEYTTLRKFLGEK